jgi:hypothetical protein
MMEVSDFIFEQGLMDLPLVGSSFTWLRPPSWSRIDRFLVSPEWEAQFPSVSQRMLPILYSDHILILLDCGDFHWGSRPFKFENVAKVIGFCG